MNKIKLYILLLGLFVGKISTSQDFHLSIYDAAPLYLNPAMTGVFDGDWRVHAQYRTQWKTVNFKPYTTGLISFDAPFKKWGFGGQIINYRAGYGNYNVLQGTVSAGYTLPLDDSKNHNISFGVQGVFTQKSIEYQLHTFDNQYSSSSGGGFDNSLPTGESFLGQKLVVPELTAGWLYYYAKEQSKLNPFIGVSAFNLLEPQESFYDQSNTLPMRIYTHLGTRVNITELFYLIPKVLIMNQASFNEQTFAVDAGYYLKSSQLYLLGGLIYRNKDAGIISLGAKRNNYIFKVAYDINLSTLTPVSTGRGGFEISFTYMKKDVEPKRTKICPRL